MKKLKLFLVGMFVVCSALALFNCKGTCTEVACQRIYYPKFTCMPKGISQYNIYLYLVRIDKSTNLILDSAGIPSDGIDIFKDWTKMGNNGNYEIKDYNYVIRTSFPSRDTLTDISYNKSITSQPCGTCTDGRNTNINITTYQNFNYKCKGKTYRDIDTLVIGK